jgi:hypothetical protein
MDDGSKERPTMTAGVDLGDKYSYLCLIDTQSGEVIEEGRLRTTPEAFRRRFCSEQQPLRVAIEAGTHSPWVSRVLEECGHEVLVANPRKTRLIYSNKRKTDEIDAENLGDASHVLIRNCFTHSNTGVRTPRLIWHSSARVRRWLVAVRSSGQPRPWSSQVLWCSLAQVPGQKLPQQST